MKAYEIHTHRQGNWKMDSVFDDRNLALHEAQKADESNRYSGVRVVEETYDETTNQTTTRVIFRGGWADKQAKAKRAAESRKLVPPKAGHGTGKEPIRKSAPRKEPAKRGTTGPVLLVLLGLAIGLGGLFGLYQISNPG